MNEENDKKSVWNKTSEEITVGDSVKFQLTVLALAATIGGTVMAAPVAVDAISERYKIWKMKRQLNKVDYTEFETIDV